MPYGKFSLVPAVLTAVLALYCPLTGRAADEAVAADEALVQQMGVQPNGPSLLAFFRKRTLSDADRLKLDQLIARLGYPSYRVRNRAFNELVAVGKPAVPLLRAALLDRDEEIVRRAQLGLAKIEGGPGPELPAAAARLLVHCHPQGAVEALLKYLPYADDEWLEEEVFACLGKLALHNGEVDPVVLAALKDRLPARRGTAAYLLGRLGDLNQRAAVRKLLADPDAAVRLRANQGLVGKDIIRSAEDAAAADETLLKEQKVPVDGAGLLGFFRKRTLSEADQQRYLSLVRQLGHPRYVKRRQAIKQLKELGSAALPFLRPALADRDEEIYMRAKWAMEFIENGPATTVPAAAVRVLLRRVPPEALETLLAYVPFADDDQVEEEVLKALCVLAARDVRVNPALLEALQDPLPARRGAAAYVLGNVGTRDDCRPARKLFRDPNPKVRLRVAQGFLAARDRNAVPELVKLFAESPGPEFTLQVEQTLTQAAGENPPAPPAERTALALQKTWSGWWEKEGSRVDLARRQESFQNLRVICEFDWNGRWNGGMVWECDRAGKQRWKIDNLLGPMDAHVLRNGNVLVAENHGQKVTERDTRGNVKWEVGPAELRGNPVACYRLPNGNTVVACYYSLMEFTRDKKVLHNINKGPNSYIFSAHLMHNGHIAIMTSMGTIEEIDLKTEKTVKTFNVMSQGNWCSVEGLRNGRFLVALMSQGKVVEVDVNGKEHWSCNVQGVHTATRLPNGNTLVACMNNRVIKEFDRSGKEVWTHNAAGRPWRIHYR
jgi:HEAT repeat protein